MIKKLSLEPTNIVPIKCNIVIFGVRRTILKISPHCWRRNEEFKVSKKAKVKENLVDLLLDKKVIKSLVQQINEKEVWFEGVNSDWLASKYYG